MGAENKESIKVKLSFRWGAITDIGKVREENQDAWFADPESGIFIVSDGMGGHQAGTLASKIVTEVLPKMIKDGIGKLKSQGRAAIKSVLNRAIVELSRRMRTESSDQTEMRGMGATLVMALLRADRAYIANMGDSRAYLFRKGKLRQLSEEHSVVALLLRSGDITPSEAKLHPARSQLSRYIGMADKADPCIRTLLLKDNDRLLLCSDGLTGVVNDNEIACLLEKNTNPQDACSMLVETANLHGGPDNITVIIVNLFGYP